MPPIPPIEMPTSVAIVSFGFIFMCRCPCLRGWYVDEPVTASDFKLDRLQKITVMFGLRVPRTPS
jgi:hypothetical protein